MPAPNDEGGMHLMRANTTAALTKNKLEDETKKQPDSMVKDSTSAINF